MTENIDSHFSTSDLFEDEHVQDITASSVVETPSKALSNLRDGLATTERPSERSARVGDVAGKFSAIRVSFPPQNLLVAALDEARLTALAIRQQREATGKRIPMPVLRTIAEVGVGKTWAAEKLVELCEPTDPEDRRRPVIQITLDTTGKQVSLPRGILRKLGKRGWSHGNDPEVLWDRAIDAMREFQVELVIFDETNRLARRPTIGPVIGGDIMDLLVRGDAAVAFLGSQEANKVFDRCPALKDRMKAPVRMKALDWLVVDEKKYFINFLGKMDTAFKETGLTDTVSRLASESVAKPLWDVCRGRLRPLCLLLEEAITALHRSNDRALVITPNVLAQAVEDHSILNEIVNYNPFTEEKPE